LPAAKPALWAAVENGDPDVVSRWLVLGVNIEERYRGWTPLMKAAEENHSKILQELIVNGAQVNACNKHGRTALSFACAPSMKKATALESIKVLLKAGADPMCQDSKGWTCFDRAQKEKRLDAIEVLNMATQSP